MNIQEENSALYFRVQSEREQTLVKGSGGTVGLFEQGLASQALFIQKACKHVVKQCLSWVIHLKMMVQNFWS